MEVDQLMEESRVVNGASMKNYAGQTVHIWLNALGSTTSTSFQGKSTDKKTISVVLDSPLNQPLSGWVEVIGSPMSNGSSIKCSEIIVFPNDENTEPLDEDAHNDIIRVIQNMQNFYEYGEGIENHNNMF